MTTDGNAPYWIKLERSGDVLTSWKSLDGKDWTSVSNATIPMSQDVYIGLCVTAHDNSLVNTSVFDNESHTLQAALRAGVLYGLYLVVAFHRC